MPIRIQRQLRMRKCFASLVCPSLLEKAFKVKRGHIVYNNLVNQKSVFRRRQSNLVTHVHLLFLLLHSLRRVFYINRPDSKPRLLNLMVEWHELDSVSFAQKYSKRFDNSLNQTFARFLFGVDRSGGARRFWPFTRFISGVCWGNRARRWAIGMATLD